MIDSMLTLTKGSVFWMAVLFVIAIVMDLGVSAVIGFQEPMFILFAAAILALFVISAIYTLAKKVVGFGQRGSDKTPRD